MAKSNNLLFSVNAGEVSDRALARVDLQKLRLAAETQKNLIPRAIGYGTFRPGTKYIAATASNNTPQFIPFVFNTETTALIELTPSLMRVLVDDTPVTRGSVSTAVSNGTFGTNLTGWTDADESGATSDWVTGGYMGLTGNGFTFAIRRQEVTVGASDQGDEHGLRITIERGPVVLRVGSTSGGDEYITETTLHTGTHSLALTPTGNFFIQFQSKLRRQVLVDSVAVEGSGVISLPTPWDADEIGDVHFQQSADVIFCAQGTARQRRIERRSQRSWSIVEYRTENGPFRAHTDSGIKITPSALSGNITLTASRPLFQSSHVGALFRMTHTDQNSTHTFTSADQYTGNIRVSGAGNDDHFSVVRSDLTGTGCTITLQMSKDEPGDWIDITTFTSNGTSTHEPDSGYANLIRFYRLIIKSGDYSTGTPTATLTYGGGSKTGVVRITAFSSSTSVSAEVLTELGALDATDVWEEGSWSDVRGWPETVALHDGRLWWGGKDFAYGSVSDDFANFDDTTEGDSGPIIRSLALGPLEGVVWLLSMQRLIGGTASQVVSMRASTLDEPMTPTNFGVRDISNRGSSHLQAVKVDTTGVYVQRNEKRLREVIFAGETNDYVTNDLTKFKPEMCNAGIVSIAVQNLPDTRVWCVLADGSVAMCCYDRTEEMVCWVDLDFGDGEVVAAGVLPGTEEDFVYLAVNRTINGSDVCYIEKLALESECVGSTLSKNIDSHLIYSGSATSTITGLSHLEGEQVVVWGNSKALHDQSGMKTVASGQITGLAEQVTSAVVGLPYDGRFKPAKLAYGAQLGTAIGQKKLVEKLLILLSDTTHKGITYGRHFDDDSDAPSGYVMNSLPGVYRGAVVTDDTLYDKYETEAFPMDGRWDTDARFCVKMMSPYPAHILGFVVQMNTHEK